MSSSSAIPQLGATNSALRDAGVFADIIPSVRENQLKGVLEIAYPKVAVSAGVQPHRDEVQEEPTIRFHPISALDKDARYTLIMTDPDLMKTNDPINGQVRHWVQPGLVPSTSGSNELTATQPAHTSFLPSAPMPLTGPHRYIFILARETGTTPIGVGERGGQADFKERLQFVTEDFIKQHGLEVVGVTFMRVAPTAAAGVDDVKLMAESAAHMVTG